MEEKAEKICPVFLNFLATEELLEMYAFIVYFWNDCKI